MEPADSITRLGFARWYERSLLFGHAWFAGSFFALVALMACAEELRFGDPLPRQLAFGAGIVAAGFSVIYGLLRYVTVLAGTLRLGEHATCHSCGTYGRFGMVTASRAHCRKCGNEWLLIDQ